MVPYFKRRGNKLIYMLQNAGEILVIDLETLEVRQEREVFHADSPMKEEVYEQSYRVLMDRKALLYEEAETAGLDLLIRYCMEE